MDVTKPQKAFEAIKKFIREEIRKHRETYDENNIRDLVDLFIQAEKNDFKDHKGLDGNSLETCIKYTLISSRVVVYILLSHVKKQTTSFL